MNRRSFLHSIGAAVAALFVPAVAARQAASFYPHLTDPDAWHLVVGNSGGKTLWVGSTTAGPGLGGGTFSYPFATISEAMDKANSVDVIVLKSGHRGKMEYPA